MLAYLRSLSFSVGNIVNLLGQTEFYGKYLRRRRTLSKWKLIRRGSHTWRAIIGPWEPLSLLTWMLVAFLFDYPFTELLIERGCSTSRNLFVVSFCPPFHQLLTIYFAFTFRCTFHYLIFTLYLFSVFISFSLRFFHSPPAWHFIQQIWHVVSLLCAARVCVCLYPLETILIIIGYSLALLL